MQPRDGEESLANRDHNYSINVSQGEDTKQVVGGGDSHPPQATESTVEHGESSRRETGCPLNEILIPIGEYIVVM